MCPRDVRFSALKMSLAGIGALASVLAACSAPLPDRPTDASETPAVSFDSPGVRRPGHGVVNPRVIRDVRPQYTPEAMRQQIAGQVELEALVGTDGLVDEVRVTKSLDAEFGLDREAVKAAKEWRFAPATVEGAPVPIVVTLVLTFTTR
jgi:TonB family protein